LWAKSQVDSDEADGEDAEGRSRSKHFFGAFALLHHSTKENVIQDIQDVVRVYYQVNTIIPLVLFQRLSQSH
jgi:hypothetical protein